MRMSALFGRTLREAPGGADVASHQLLLRAGFIRQLAAGIFSLLPLGQRSVDRLERILRQEMDRIGGQEVTMPVVQPADLWRATGRWSAIGAEMGRLVDRGGRDLALAMTHEEVVADLARTEIQSYRQLPAMIYHLQTKWRDDARPRAGLIRVREFTMLDSYSLDADEAGLTEQYQAHFDAYKRIFASCGLPVTIVEADTGVMGGSESHEYMYLSPVGEDTLILCDACGYTANRQVAAFARPAPIDEAPAPIERVETPGTTTIAMLADFLGIPESRTAKAVFLMATLAESAAPAEPAAPTESTESTEPAKAAEAAAAGERLVLAVVRGDMDVNETKLAGAVGATDLRPAHDEEIWAAGAVPGYASPIGLPDGAAIVVVDETVAATPNLVGGANEAGYHLRNTTSGRDYQPDIVADIVAADAGLDCVRCGAVLRAERGVEVGNIFKLGTKYADALGARYLDAEGVEHPIVMGSYGIGVGRTLACIAECHRDDAGIIWPISIAPADVHLVSLKGAEEAAGELYTALRSAGIDVLWDDRDERPGVKFADADLIGVPIRLTLGARSLAEGSVELKLRRDADAENVPLAGAVAAVAERVAALRGELEPA